MTLVLPQQMKYIFSKAISLQKFREKPMPTVEIYICYYKNDFDEFWAFMVNQIYEL